MAPMASMAPLLRKSSSPPSSPFCLLSRSMAFSNHVRQTKERLSDQMDADVPSSCISRPLSETLKELNRKTPDSFIKTRVEDWFSVKYVPWDIINRITTLHAPEWSGEVRSVMYSAYRTSVTVVYRVTLYGADAEIYRESSGAESTDDAGYGDPVQKAEAMAYRRPFARLGLYLLLYHGDMV